MMENKITTTIKRDDGQLVSLTITPQFVDDDGRSVANRVYELTSESIEAIGVLAFHLEDIYQWEYCGHVLTDDEIEQVVITIQKETV